MKRKGRRPEHSCHCYYGDRLVGRCHTADGEAYALLMAVCGGNAARALREWAYFSPELRGVLEGVAGIQRKEDKKNGTK